MVNSCEPWCNTGWCAGPEREETETQ
jgi:hypothetical protein